jgi:hypothetical protein
VKRKSLQDPTEVLSVVEPVEDTNLDISDTETLPNNDTAEPPHDLLCTVEELRTMMVEYENFETRPNLPRVKTNEICQHACIINKAIAYIPTQNLTEVDCLVYVSALLATKRAGRKAIPAREGSRLDQPPPWKQRLNKKIKQTRATISKLQAQKDNSPRVNPNLNAQIEEAKQRLLALSGRLKRYTKQNETHWDNKNFKENPGKVYRKLRGEQKANSAPPEGEATTQFWKNIWESKKDHNKNAEWLTNLRDKQDDFPEQMYRPISLPIGKPPEKIKYQVSGGRDSRQFMKG